MPYATDTSVSTDRSLAEIRSTVMRYGATGFGFLEDSGRAAVTFAIGPRRVRIVVPLPDLSARAFTHTPGKGLLREPKAQREAWEQACRQRWRALALVVKAKLEAVEAGIASFDNEFLGYLVLPDGSTVGESIASDLPAALEGTSATPLALTAGVTA